MPTFNNNYDDVADRLETLHNWCVENLDPENLDMNNYMIATNGEHEHWKSEFSPDVMERGCLLGWATCVPGFEPLEDPKAPEWYSSFSGELRLDFHAYGTRLFGIHGGELWDSMIWRKCFHSKLKSNLADRLESLQLMVAKLRALAVEHRNQ